MGYDIPVADLDLQKKGVGGGGSSRPWDKGGAGLQKNVFGLSGLSLV